MYKYTEILAILDKTQTNDGGSTQAVGLGMGWSVSGLGVRGGREFYVYLLNTLSHVNMSY